MKEPETWMHVWSTRSVVCSSLYLLRSPVRRGRQAPHSRLTFSTSLVKSLRTPCARLVNFWCALNPARLRSIKWLDKSIYFRPTHWESCRSSVRLPQASSKFGSFPGEGIKRRKSLNLTELSGCLLPSELPIFRANQSGTKTTLGPWACSQRHVSELWPFL